VSHRDALPKLDVATCRFLAAELKARIGEQGYELWPLGASGAWVVQSLMPFLIKWRSPERVIKVQVDKHTMRLATPSSLLSAPCQRRRVIVDTVIESGDTLMSTLLGSVEKHRELNLDNPPMAVVITDFVGVADIAVHSHYRQAMSKLDYLYSQGSKRFEQLDAAQRALLSRVVRSGPDAA